jgi:hypothetical protein
MLKNQKRIILPLFFLGAFYALFALSCTHERIPNHDYPEEFQPYIDRFFKEASLRNLNIEPDNYNIVIEFEKLQFPLAGFCLPYTHKIQIDSIFWHFTSESNREFLLAHELGHCILGRPHRNEKTQQGECLSIMRGAENGFDCILNFESPSWRKYYYDELFQVDSEGLYWYKEANQNNFSQRVLAAVIDTFRTKDSTFIVDLNGFNTANNYEISLNFNWEKGSNQRATIFFAKLSYWLSNAHPSVEIDILNRSVFSSEYENQMFFDADTTNIVIRKIDNFEYFYVNKHLIHGFDVLPKPKMNFNVLTDKKVKIRCEVYSLLK